MPTGCSIPNCRNSRRMRQKLKANNPDRSETEKALFFRFPTSKTLLCEKWKRIVPRSDWEPRPNDRICSDHFTSNCFLVTKHVRKNSLGRKLGKNSSSAENSPEKGVSPIVKYVRTLRPGSIPTKISSLPQASVKKLQDAKPAKFRPPDKKIPIIDLNPYLMCAVCKGYYVNPVTITECLHTFCRSCLVRHFYSVLKCPACGLEVHPTDPMTNVRYDALKQDILNRLLPHVEADEERRENAFYDERGLPRPVRQEQHKTAPLSDLQQEDDDDKVGKCFYPKQKLVNLVLEYAGCVGLHIRVQPLMKKFVRVAACLTIAQLKKFLKLKLRSRTEIEIDLLCDNALLEDGWDLEFVAEYFYEDDPDGLIQLHYVISSHGLQMAAPDLFRTPPPSPVTTPQPPQYEVISSDEDDVQIRIRNQVSPMDFEPMVEDLAEAELSDVNSPLHENSSSAARAVFSASDSSVVSEQFDYERDWKPTPPSEAIDHEEPARRESLDSTSRDSYRQSPLDFTGESLDVDSPLPDIPMPALTEEKSVDLLTMLGEDLVASS